MADEERPEEVEPVVADEERPEEVEPTARDDDAPAEAEETSEESPPELEGVPDVPEGPGGPVIECDALSRWYGQVIAVNNLTVDVEPGITGLLGPNGAGKTTLMQMIMGLRRPSNGTIEVLGQKPWGNTGLMGRIGYVSEKEPPWRDLTGRECAVRAARLSGMTSEEADEAVDRALEQVGLAKVQDRTVDGYSRGMRQRLKFALALLHDPELYILDEPLLGTDPATRMHLIEIIRELDAQGRSVLISTHVLTDIEAMTQRIMLMNKGRLMAYGNVSEIRDVLEQYPRTVRVTTPEPEALGARIWPWETVLSVEKAADSVTVRTRDPKAFYESLQDLLTQGQVQFQSVIALDEDLESVFRYLVE